MKLTRRDLMKRFGLLSFALTPIARAMGYVQGGTFQNAPRFVMFFIGGSLYPSSTNPASLSDLSATPLAPLQPHAQDLVLFKSMNIHDGDPITNGYQEEHGAGLFGCVTGHSYKYSKNDSYYAYTDHQSIDVAIANHYQTVPALAALPIASLHLGAGAHSDADNVGLGQRYVSFRERQSGDTQYGNAIEPIQDAGQVYDRLMMSINLVCGKTSMQPGMDDAVLRAALQRKKSVLDFRLADIADAKRVLGMDSEHAHKLDGMLENWRRLETVNDAQLAQLGMPATTTTSTPPCPTGARPTGNGANRYNLDVLSPVQDQMIALIKLAFEWDLTRVVAFTLSGASSGETLPSRGINQAHHTLEHNGDVQGLFKMGTYYCEKLAALLAALKGIDDGDGHTALYNSSIVLGMECWSNSSQGHYLTNIPFVFAGQGAGKFQTGRIVDANGRNNNDLLVSAQNASGIASSVFGLPSLCQGPIL